MTTPLCVYFSSVTENTKAFVEKLGFDSARIPLYPRDEPLLVDRPYLLFVPTYGRVQVDLLDDTTRSGVIEAAGESSFLLATASGYRRYSYDRVALIEID